MRTLILSVAAAVVLSLALAVPVAIAQAPVALAPIKAVTHNERGFLAVDGKPFFPILLYADGVDDASLQKYRDAGINTLTVHNADIAAKLPAKGLYGAVHASKKMDDASGVLILLSTDSPVLVFKENPIEKTKAANASARALCPDRPTLNAIGYWLNEPEGVIKNTLPGKDKYEDLVGAIDIAGPYLYPVPYQPVGTVGDAVSRARDATKGTKPLLPILQLFQWEKATRHATATELRCMVYLSLIEGATGIGYFHYNSVKDPAKSDPEALKAWESLAQLNKEVAEIGGKLMSGTKNTRIQAAKNDGVKWLAINDKDAGASNLLVLLANPGDKEATITLTTGAINGLAETKSFTLKPLEARTVQFQFVGN